MIKRETLILLRVPFSVFFLPVFLFAWSQSEAIRSWERVLGVALLLHIVVYPLIAGFENRRACKAAKIPLPKGFDSILLMLTLLSLVSAYFLSTTFLIQLIAFFGISLLTQKQVPAMLWKMTLRGAFIYWMAETALLGQEAGFDTWNEHPWAMLAASAMMAALYLSGKIFSRSMGVPGSEQDKQYSPNFAAISILLVFTSICFALHFNGQWLLFLILQFFLLPVYSFLVYWYKQVKISTRAASFDLSMRMSLLLVFSLSFYFLCVGFTL